MTCAGINFSDILNIEFCLQMGIWSGLL